MKFCPQCGTPRLGNFCGRCGFAFPGEAATGTQPGRFVITVAEPAQTDATSARLLVAESAAPLPGASANELPVGLMRGVQFLAGERCENCGLPSEGSRRCRECGEQ